MSDDRQFESSTASYCGARCPFLKNGHCMLFTSRVGHPMKLRSGKVRCNPCKNRPKGTA